MIKKIALPIIMISCATIYSMQFNDREKEIKAIMEQTNILTRTMVNNKPSIEQWLTLVKNCGKLEAALEYDLIKDEKSRADITQSIPHIEGAFKSYFNAEKKVAMVKTMLLFGTIAATNSEEKDHQLN